MMADTLYIIDGHAQIYRAYYAVAGLSASTGEPTNATFGFISMFLKLLENRHPTHIALAMDAGSSQREQLDPQYKAQRKAMPEDMPAQIQRITQMMALAGVPLQRVEGFEADDVIATIVRLIRADTLRRASRVYICSRDKDLDALIDEQTVLFDIQENAEFDAASLLAKKGYRPDQATDVLALTGDNADNIAGIPGVGPKTAAKWIAQFGSLDGLIAAAGTISGKIGEALRTNLGVLDQSRKLVQLQTDVPVNFSWEQCHFDPQCLMALAPVFEELNFKRLLPQLARVQRLLAGDSVVDAAPATATLPLPRDKAISTTTPKVAPSGDRVAPTPKRSTLPPAAEMNLFNQVPDTLPPSTAAQPEGLPMAMDRDTPADTEAELTANAAMETSPSLAAVPQLAPVTGDYRLVNSAMSLEAMVRELREIVEHSPHRWLSVDTETDALGAMKSNICGISLCARPGVAWYVAIRGPGECTPLEALRQHLGPLLADPAIKKIGQNIKYDLNVLRRCGLPLAGVYLDTMVVDYLLDSSRPSHSMDSMAAAYLGLKPIAITELIGKGQNQRSFADVPLDRACSYAAEDADVTLRLAELLYPRLGAAGLEKLLLELEMPLVTVLADMEYAGVKVDVKSLQALSLDLEKRRADLKVRIRAAAGVDFNFDSPKQLAQVLFGRLGLRVVKKTKTGPSTDITVLEALADDHPVPALILEYRQLTKLQGTYLEPLAAGVSPQTGRVHAHFNQTVAETGRLSSSDPNLQNIPIRTEIGKDIRRAFVAEDGFVLISADYSQIELRMLAHFCREPALLEAFAGDQDIHAYVAAQIHNVALEQVTPEMRRVAKSVNFGIIYGQTSYGLAKLLKIPEREAAAFISAYKQRFPAIEVFAQHCTTQALTEGSVTTIMGRRRQIPQIHSTNQSIRQFGQRAAINSVIQGSAADLIKIAMVRIHGRIADQQQDIRLILQIHDELVLESRASMAEHYAGLVRDEMQHAMALAVELKVDIAWGTNWLAAK